MSAAHRVEAVVIGAGVLGLACARALAMAGKEVVLLERESMFGSGTSSRNSEVIHAGLYYPQKSLKAELCVKGRKLLYDYCQTRSIPHEQMGKLIVATHREQYHTNINDLYEKGTRNGVSTLRILSKQDISYMEPDITCEGALYSPETGVVDSHSFMLSMLGEAEDHGAFLAVSAPVDFISILGDSNSNEFKIESDGTELRCSNLINCAGLYAAHVIKPLFQHFHKFKSSSSIPMRQYYAKGNYYRLEGQTTPFHHLVYPVPEPGGLGVHATLDLAHNCRFGPDVEWMPPSLENPNDLDFTVDPTRSEKFYHQVRKYWPGLKDGALAPDYAGIRPKVSHPIEQKESLGYGNGNNDFVILGSREHGIPGLVHMLGMESPGLTSSLAVAEKVVDMLSQK